jgi:hypothetical protein
MTSRWIRAAVLMIALGASSACAGLYVSSYATINTPRQVPLETCTWVWLSSYWETGWVCLPTPVVYRVDRPRRTTTPFVTPRTRTAVPSAAVPRGTDPQTPPAGRGRSGRGVPAPAP